MIQKMYVAGGCFWGLEELMRTQRGVRDITAGYSGGTIDNPTYENHEVAPQSTIARHDFAKSHAEAIEIVYDDTETSFWYLLDFFFQIHNPTTLNQQGNDKGDSYRSAIFYQNEEEKKQAEEFIKIVNDSGRWNGPVVTTLEAFTKFWRAEEYHQDYLQKNPGGYTCHAIYFESYLS